MDSAHRPRAARSAGALSARILLALASLAGAFTLTVVGAEPAGAYTIARSSDRIVLTSDRLSNNQTHATLIVTLRSTGDWTLRVEAHNTAATRKFVEAYAWMESPWTGHTWAFYSGERRRVDRDEWDEWEHTGWSALLEGQWDEVMEDPHLEAVFDMIAFRIRV
jgi:hypothetical protein